VRRFDSSRGHFPNFGAGFVGARVQIVESGELVRMYCGDELVRTLVLDCERRYQQPGKRRGGEVEIRA
jgi:hypothetical protein